MKSLIDGGMHYILNGDGIEELYDLRADPGETHDLIGTDRGKALAPSFRETLQRNSGK